MSELDSVINKISRLDLTHPYIWQLRITTAEFEALRSHALMLLTANRMEAITRYPIILIAYIAEWYKRCYTGDNVDSAIALSSSELEQLWNSSGIDIDRFVACREDGTHRWLYSIYVFGGLALRFEMQRGDEGRFMRKLCRLYHGEDEQLNVSDQSALAFRQSIEREQSLFEYFRSIINGDFPFAEEDLHTDPLFNDFIKALTGANLTALARADKFSLIHGMCYEPGQPYGRRILILHMRPEVTGKGCHGYLRYDRLRAWGVQDPDKVYGLSLSLRFSYKGVTVRDVDFENPLKEWEHTGWRESGMLCNGDPQIFCGDVPCEHFDKVEAIVRTSTDERFVVGKWECAEYVQMWLKDEYRMLWTDQKNHHQDSALFYTSPWHGEKGLKFEDVRLLDSKDRSSDFSVRYSELTHPILLTDGENIVGPFFPSQGVATLELKRYDNLIRYDSEGCVSVKEGDDEYSLPPIFYPSDIRIISIGEDENKEIISPEKIEFMSGRTYALWDAANSPAFGRVGLRVTSGNRIWKTDVIYLQPVDNSDSPIIRDLNEKRLTYVSAGKQKTVEVKDFTPEESVCIDCRIIAGNAEAIISLYQPLAFRRWIMDNNHYGLIEQGDFTISWILRNRICLEELSESGYRSYSCANIKKNLGLSGELLYNWREGNDVAATDLDPGTFSWLRLNYGTPPPAAPGLYVCWDTDCNTKPVVMQVSSTEQVDGIAFKDARECTTPQYGFPIFGTRRENHDDLDWCDDDDLDWCDDDTKEASGKEVEVSPLRSFIVACEYQTYFALFAPFDDSNKINRSNVVRELIEPLTAYDGGRITENHLDGLKRLNEEFNFNIEINDLRK